MKALSSASLDFLSLRQRCIRLLDSCVQTKNAALATRVHSCVVVAGLQHDSFVATKLISLYSAGGEPRKAEAVFRRVPVRDAFVLNSMIRGYCAAGMQREAIDFFRRNARDGVEPDSYTFSCVLKACASLSELRQGKELHRMATDRGLASDVFVGNSLICLYGKCGCLENAIQVFEGMSQQDTVSWTSMISACVMNGCYFEASKKLRDMIECGFKPDQATILTILGITCADTISSQVHGYVLRSGMEFTPMIHNSFISAYGKCGKVKEARQVFDSCNPKTKVSWNALISVYAQNGLFDESMQLLGEMRISGFDLDVITYSGIISAFSQNDLFHEAFVVFEELLSAGLKPDVIAIASTLPAIPGLQSFSYCKQIHAYSYRHQLESDRRIRNALVSVYSKFGLIQDGEKVFQAIRDKDVISWSSMVMGYAQNEYYVEALNIFRKMIRAKTEPNPITITSVLSACAGVSGLRQGKELHSWAVKNSVEGQAFIGTSLVDMYMKCGKVKDSRRVFELIEDKSLVTYNVMIGGYAIHGLTEKAIEIFQMVEEPDQITFISILSACSHGGLTDEGIEIFNSMKDYKVTPKEGHFACMVDLLARSGKLEQALDLVRKMPMQASSEMWGVLLGACKIHSNLDVGIYTGKQIIESGAENSGYYVLLANILADFQRWEDVNTIRELMQEKEIKKTSGCSWIEVNNGVHSFVAKERAQHPEWDCLFGLLNALNEHIRGSTY